MLFANSPHSWHHHKTQVFHSHFIRGFTSQIVHFNCKFSQQTLLLNPILITYTVISAPPLLWQAVTTWQWVGVVAASAAGLAGCIESLAKTKRGMEKGMRKQQNSIFIFNRGTLEFQTPLFSISRFPFWQVTHVRWNQTCADEHMHRRVYRYPWQDDVCCYI